MTLNLAIWDMDGTIVDSREIIGWAMDRAFEACGRPAPGYEQTRQIVGLGLKEACAQLVPEGLSEVEIKALAEAYSAAFISRREDADFSEPLYAGALETLERLADAGWLIAMATGKSRRGIRALFEMHPLEQYFDTIHCADDGPGKPHPAMCLDAMDKMGAEPHQSIMIGDAIHDIRMGRSAGVYTMAVTWGFGLRNELEAVDPHEIHDDFHTLNESLDRFRARDSL
ncbi:MAG: HAD-IA family hydrolase [Pseudomonadota bacterium]